MCSWESTFWKKGMFFGGEWRSSVIISHRSKNFSFCCWVTSIIYDINALCFQHIELRWNKLFCMWQSWINILKEKNVLRQHQFQSFDIWGSEKFVWASELNLSLATGLASWKVSLKPWILERQKCISATSTCTDGSWVTAWNKTHHLVRSYIVYAVVMSQLTVANDIPDYCSKQSSHSKEQTSTKFTTKTVKLHTQETTQFTHFRYYLLKGCYLTASHL